MGTPNQPKSLREYWAEQINAWKRSGLTGPQFCKTHELIYHRFAYWRKKLETDSGPSEAPASSGGGGFVAVSRRSAPEAGGGLTLSLPNGLILRGIRADNVAVVRQLLEVL